MARFGSVLLAAALTFLTGCASTRAIAGAPISDTSAIAGRWVGTVTPGLWGLADAFNLTITPDGQFTATWNSNTAWGTVAVQNGQATFEMHPMLYEGTIRLYEAGDRRELVLDDDWQAFKARVVPHK